ncbi:EAL domain-containing protein [Arthrobacter sp. SIMBA_036]|uniref:sensor domain-containing phosphodiesterase n=1 Tax=Arthrobacter sp. SIMBA_036 TaxID=3085778 RepID=UPI00397BCAF8
MPEERLGFRRHQSVLPGRLGHWLLVLIGLEAGVAVSISVPHLFGDEPWMVFDDSSWVLYLLALALIPVVLWAAWALVRQQQRERGEAFRMARLIDTMSTASREWLWATGPDGRFIFCSPACRDLTGYDSAELVGLHFSLVIAGDDLAAAVRDRVASESEDGSWSGLESVCRRKNGTTVVVEVSGSPLRDSAGNAVGFEGSARAVAPHVVAATKVRGRVEAMIADHALLTAFQPIRSLDSGSVIGAEALSRFLSSPGNSPEAWFAEAESVGLGLELEIAALETALSAARGVPPFVYVAFNVSPGLCLDPRLVQLLSGAGVPARRIVLEVTERHPVLDYGPLAAALSGLRRDGIGIAVDDAGAGFASMRHILQLKPDVIKLDRNIIAGIDSDLGQRALGAAMVGFATQIGAVLVAEGIETFQELEAAADLGMSAGQGFLLGRPTVRPEDWTSWREKPALKGRPWRANEAADG